MEVRIRDWTFTHWWVRPTVKVWFDFYHKSVSYSGKENIDWQSPIIFAPSHQNAFTDALCLILPTRYTNDRFIYPLIRADAFGQNRALDWILTVFHMLPVYRPRDNVNLKQRNESVFSHCHEILFKNRNLLIHPEGNCVPKKQVGKFKKGLARIALGAEAEKDFNLGVNVIPVGINYREITGARKGIHVQFGKPIMVSDYQDRYHNSTASAITDLTRTVEKGVRKVTVDIDTTDYQLTEQVIDFMKKNRSSINTRSKYDKEEVQFEKGTIAQLKEAEQRNPGLKDGLRESLRKVNKMLNEYNLDINYSFRESKSVSRLIAEGIGYFAVLPVVIYGWINNIIPWFLMNKVGEKVNENQFKNSARMVAGLLIFPFSYILQTAVVGVYLGSGINLLFYLISLPVTGIICLKISEYGRQWIQHIRLKRVPQSKRQKLSEKFDKITKKIGLPAKVISSSDPA
jgi:1-acyl-sn-glycerol-3-phosphate acyltransferase